MLVTYENVDTRDSYTCTCFQQADYKNISILIKNFYHEILMQNRKNTDLKKNSCPHILMMDCSSKAFIITLLYEKHFVLEYIIEEYIYLVALIKVV